jgi:hypothetical protein
MRTTHCIVVLILLSALRCFFTPLAFAQESQKDKHFMLVTSFGPGGIELPSGGVWKAELLTIYDDGRRPVAQFSKTGDGLNVSYILFENLSGQPNAQGCREDVINPLVGQQAKSTSKRVDGEATNTAGETLATTSYLIDAGGLHQHNLFGFAGNTHTCAEIHISSMLETPEALATMKAVLNDFHPDLNYKASFAEYFVLASFFFNHSQPKLAAPYYRASLEVLPDAPSSLQYRRVMTDQLVMSLGMSGDLKNSRALADKAAASDPDYPLNYYNLACVDAEQLNAKDARTHLQQAFDRRANVIKGESMPDPTKDDSLLKLKNDKEFWSFVENLPKK